MQFDILTCVYSFVCEYNSATLPSPITLPFHPRTLETPESGTFYSHKRLPKCGRMKFSRRFYYFVLVFSNSARHVYAVYLRVARNRVKRKTIKKKSIPLGGEKNVNDKRRMRARTYVYIYTLHYGAHTIIPLYVLHWLCTATACSDNDGRICVSTLHLFPNR